MSKSMRKHFWKRWIGMVTATAMLLAATPAGTTAYAQSAESVASAAAQANTTGIVINEVESDAPNKGNDWVEITNTGSKAVDLSGWYLTDDKGEERKTEGKTTPLAKSTVLEPGAFLVLEETVNFDFGLGKADTAILYDANGEQVDSYAYTSVAAGTWSRQADGSFADAEATKGTANAAPSKTTEPEQPETKTALVLNEINSSPDDWVELMNTGSETLDISGYELRDNSDDHRWRFPDGSQIAAGELLVVDAKANGLVYDDQTKSFAAGTFEAAIGIGSGDSIRLYDKNGKLLDEYSWTEHASYDGDPAKASYGRYPDGTGAFRLTKETKGTANAFYAPTIAINEVESNGDTTDWVEIMNTGTQAVDISGWYLLDNDPVGHKADVTPVAEGTTLEPGALYVFDQNKDFTFGLGKADKAAIYDASGNLITEYEWAVHANGVYARIPDGTGEFQDFATATKGKKNKVVNPVVINEVQSNDPSGGADWVELANPTAETLNISGLILKDNKDKDSYTIPEGTTIPANGFLVIYQDDSGVQGFAFGLGKGDSVRIFEDGEQIAIATWPDGSHTNPTWGLYPDVNGSTYQNTLEATPGAANKFAGIPDVIAWPGPNTIKTLDTTATFLEDSSGLDFYNGQLYAIDNGTGTFWVMDIDHAGNYQFASGFEQGKRIVFQKDKNSEKAKGPDTEGITVDGNGMVYAASERDNSNKGVNYNTILMVNPKTSGTRLVAEKEWNLTASLPQVSANMGIEAVEWVANAEVNGKLIDQKTGKAYDPADYPNAVAGGVFFVALEDNGHVYAYVLNKDGSAVQIADIDSKLGGAMALDYDTYENKLWVAADDGYGNRMAQITLNGTTNPEIVHINPPTELDTTANNEGFAIAEKELTQNGTRPVFRFCDGVTSGALTLGYLNCDYQSSTSTGGGSGSAVSTPSDDVVTVKDTDPNGAGSETQTTVTKTTVKNARTETVRNDQGQETVKTTADVSKALGDKLIRQAASNQANTIEITVKSQNAGTTGHTSVTEVLLPKAMVDTIAKDTHADLAIKTGNGDVTLDSKALQSIAKEAKTDTVTIVITENTQLKETQKPAAAIVATGTLFDVSVETDTKLLHTLDGGQAYVTLPVPEKLKGKDLLVIYVDDNGLCRILDHSADKIGAEDYLRFTTTHFSNFAVVDKAEAEQLIQEQNAAHVKKRMQSAKFKVTTSKTSQKSVKVQVTARNNKALISDSKSLGYTVKYQFYRSSKKSAGYKLLKTKTTNTFTNTKGTRGAKYYYKARVLVYDGKRLVAKSTLKQCSYGVRIWKK